MEDNIKNKETDPVSGRELSNLTNYNQGDPVNTEPISMEEFYKKYSPNNEVIGGSGSVETVDYSPSKFDTSIFINELPNVEHLRSQNQGVLSTLGRSGANFFGQTLVNVAGGVVGTAYGGASAIINGDHTKLWDNEIMEALDTASEYIREDLFKVYNSNDYEGRNLVQRMLLNPAQFSYDLLDTLSFTAGAVITEYLTAGMASAAIAPKALRYLKKLGQGTKSAEVAGKLGSTSAQLFSGAMKGGALARQLWTGAGYEAMVESRQTVLEARENMLQDWLSDNPEYTIDNIPDEIRQEIDDSLSNMGLLSFIANMSLVGFSNMAQFPTVFRNSFNDSRKGLWRRIGRNASGDYYDKITDLTKAQRFARSAATFLKNPFLEGVVEEGGQSVISGLSQEYFDRKNNSDSREESVDFLSALANNIIDTYTSAEGWEEIGMGIIVGSIGGPGRGLIPGRSGVDPSTGERGSLWTGGIYGEFQQRGEVDNKVDGIVKVLNDNPNILDNIKANFDYMVKAHSIDKEQNYHLAAGDIFNFKNRQDDKVHAYIMSRIDAGLQSDLQTTIEELQAMDAEVLYQEFKGDEADANASEAEKLEFKESLINEYQQKIDKTIEAHNIVNRSSVVDNNDNLREYLTHALSVANYMDIRENNINKELAKLTNNIIGSSASLESKTTLIPMQQEINSIKKELEDPELDSLSKAALQSLLNKLEKELASLKDPSFSLMASDYSQLREFAKRDPVQFAATLSEVLPLLRDASKVKDYRQELIDNFNRYFTVEGAKEFKKLEKKVNEERERIARERQETEAKEQREQERKDNIEKAKAKTKKKVTPETSEKDTPETTEEDTDPETGAETPRTTETEEDAEEFQPVEEKVPEEVIDGEQTEETLKNNIESIKENIQDANDLLDNPTLPESIKEPIATQRAELEAELESLERQLEELESVQEEDIPEAEDSEPESPEQEAESLLAEREVKNEQIEDFEDETEITSPVDDNSRNKLIEELKDLPVYNTIKRGFGAVLAYLNVSKKEYIQASGAIRLVDQYDEAGELLIEDNMDSRILSPKHFNVGDVLSMRPVTYQEIQERGEGEYTEEDFKRDSQSVDTFPIGIFDSDNKLIGFYPTRDNIHRNTSSEYKSRFLLENREHRTRIFENPNNIFSTTITAKTPGVPAFNKITNQKPLLEVLGDGNKISDNIELAIAKTISVNQEGATLFNSNSKSRGRVTKTLSAPNTSLMPGFLYAVVPSAVDKVYIPVPLNVNGIGQTNAEVLTEALRLFATTDRTESDLKSINTISEEFDITTLKGLRDFINKFTYSSSSNNNDTNTVRILENRLLLSPTNSEVNFTMEEIVESEESRKTIASVLANRFPTVKLSEINNKESFISYTLGEDGVIQRVENDNFQSYLSNNEIVTTSLHGVDIGDGEKAFGMQPVIALSEPVKGEELAREDSATQEQESFTKSNKGRIEEVGEENSITSDIQTVAGYKISRNSIETPDGKTKQTYTIQGDKILNKEGKEVFKKDTKDRRKILANHAVSTGEATVVTYRDQKFVVDKEGKILSVKSGNFMNWDSNHGHRKAIMDLAKDLLSNESTQSTQNTLNTSENTGTPQQGYKGLITTLNPNEVYVFGANDKGLHGAGAAGAAMDRNRSLAQISKLPNGTKEKWAVKGQTGMMEGTSGKSYGLVTVEGSIGGKNSSNRMSNEVFTQNIKDLYQEALNNPDLIFKIAYSNLEKRSLNGFTGYEMMELFRQAGPIPNNIQFSESWVNNGIYKDSNQSIKEAPSQEKPKPKRRLGLDTNKLKGKDIDFNIDPNFDASTLIKNTRYQKLTQKEKSKTIEQVTKEHRSITALKDLSAKLAWRIGGKVEFVNRTDVDWKGYNQGMTSVLNEAYMTPDTPFHEILAHPIIRALKYSKKIGGTINLDGTLDKSTAKVEFSKLYQNLLKELETGRGKEVFEQVKRDYRYKDGSSSISFLPKYTLEEQQEEAIVTLLGMMAADKLDAKKDATLISKLKELWKQISGLVKSLLKQDGIKIDELPITTTLNDLAEIMAYGNNKIILPGYKVEYSTPLGNKYDALEEVNNEIRGLADSNVEVDLSSVRVNTEDFNIPGHIKNFSSNSYYYRKLGDTWQKIKETDTGTEGDYENISLGEAKTAYANEFTARPDLTDINQFIQKNKQYEQSKEIIEQWKKENNIQYDPEEVYSRGQGFYSSIGAYSNLELDLLLQNLLQHIGDNKKAGGEFTISAFTKPIDRRLKHIEGTGDRVRFVIYPKSEHIKWAAPTDVYSGSVWDAHEKVSKDKKSELLGVSFTKAPALGNINRLSPNLADIIDNLSHAHNELGIELTTNNFRIEYDDNIDYSTKKLIDNVNKILDDKYGKLVKPEIKQKEFVTKYLAREESAYGDFKTTIFDTEKEALDYKKSMEQFDDVVVRISRQVGKQPTQTRENTTSIESVEDKIIGKKDNLHSPFSEQEKTLNNYKNYKIEKRIDGYWWLLVDNTLPSKYETEEKAIKHVEKRIKELEKKIKDNAPKQKKEYTSQAEINLKIAALKEVTRKYPRSLITSKVVPINPLVGSSEIQYSKINKYQETKDLVNPMFTESRVSSVEELIKRCR